MSRMATEPPHYFKFIVIILINQYLHFQMTPTRRILENETIYKYQD